MTLVINTNVSALNAQRQLLNSSNDLSQANERLASGRRVNTAADDAAGLAISNRQTSQIRGLNQAIRNANDGVSLIQTAEGALQETTNILQRIRELSIQAANGIFSDADRGSLDAEAQQLIQELDRISTSTTFNGQPLLDGSLSNVTLHIGARENDFVDLNIQGFSPSSLGSTSGDLVGEVSTGLASLTALAGGDELQINDVDISALDAATTVNEALSIINADLEGSGAEASTLVSLVADAAGNGILAGGETLTLSLLQGDGTAQTYNISDTSSLADLASRINTDTAIEASINDEGRLVLTAENAETLTVTTDVADATGGISSSEFRLVLNDVSAESRGVRVEAGTGLAAAELVALGLNVQDQEGNLTGAAVAATGSLNAGDLIINGVEIGAITEGADPAAQVDNAIEAINLLSDQTGVIAFEAAGSTTTLALRSVNGDPIEIRHGVGINSPAEITNFTDVLGLRQQNAAEGTGTVAGISIDTAQGARAAIPILDVAIEQINATRANLGAINNRLDFTVSNLANVVENTSAARSRILDADFAAESSNLARAQVLQQASQAILAQANAAPQQVLQLLQP